MKIKKAVIPAAGFGSRMLPASKAIPKEMLPIVDKPSIQYIVEEAAAAGVEDILIITNRGKGAIEDHFDLSPELDDKLRGPGKEDIFQAVMRPATLANVFFLRQKEIRGLGHAVGTARAFVGDDPFLVLYGDDVMVADYPVSRQLIDAFEAYRMPCLGIKQVPREEISKYSSLSVHPLKDNLFRVDDMIEKPRPGEEFSLYSILGRCLLTPEIFDIIDNLPPGAVGEIQLTDAIKQVANTRGCIGVDFAGTRYDIGNKLGFMKANTEVALAHPEIGAEYRRYLEALLSR